jgi:hypothetical protein
LFADRRAGRSRTRLQAPRHDAVDRPAEPGTVDEWSRRAPQIVRSSLVERGAREPTSPADAPVPRSVRKCLVGWLRNGLGVNECEVRANRHGPSKIHDQEPIAAADKDPKPYRQHRPFARSAVEASPNLSLAICCGNGWPWPLNVKADHALVASSRRSRPQVGSRS